MPELPDLDIYVRALAARTAGQTVRAVTLDSPFVLRTAVPPVQEAVGQAVGRVFRLGKRIVLSLDGGDHLVLHLMRAGRLRWLGPGDKPPGRITLARVGFGAGTLAFTEAGTKRRASLHFVRGSAALQAFDAGGIEVPEAGPAAFLARLRSENHTLKRALTDPRLFAGIGGAYSDEILHRARLSPMALSRSLSDEEGGRLHAAARDVLTEWTGRLAAAAGEAFPANVTAFREGMAVHGRYGQPCPVCATPVQRIVYAETETNYCPRCQTDGRILADRALSRLLKASFPRDIDELG